MRYELKNERDKQCAQDTAEDLAKLMRTLNSWNSTPLCTEFSRSHGAYGERCIDPESVYGMVSGALAATLALLGVPPDSSAMEDAVQAMHDGCSAQDAIKAYAVKS